MHTLDRAQARRIAVRAQLCDLPRPTDLIEVVEQLTLVQLDPTAAVAPSADLVAWSRLGSSYEPEHMRKALEEDGTLFELGSTVRPMDDLPLYLAEMAAWPTREPARRWLEANDAFRRDVLALLRAEGPLLSRDVPDTCAVPWESTGWTNDRNVTRMLELLLMRGEVAVAGRRARQRLWDVADRVYPDVVPVPADEARRVRGERRLRSLGIVRAGHAGDAGDAGEEAVVEGVAGTWRVDPEALGRPFEGRTVLLSPLDRLVFDRVRIADLFGFEYLLEMYKPKAQRRWGYFALPVLHHDRLVGKVDATADRKAGVLRVDAIHEDAPFPRAVAEAVDAELDDLASWLGLVRA